MKAFFSALPRPLQPLALGLAAIPVFGAARSVLSHSGTGVHLAWGLCVIPWMLVGVMRSDVTQRVIGGGRLDNRVTLRLLVSDVLFFMVLAPAGLVFLFPVAAALAAAVHVPRAGSRAWRRAAALTSILYVGAQVLTGNEFLPAIMPTGAAHFSLAACFALALMMMADTGVLTRQKEAGAAALAAAQEGRHSDLVWAACHDGLTGLLNRSGLEPALAAARASAKPGAGIGVVFMDLDGFKAVNDTQGHAAGDQLLRAVAGRLLNAMRPGDALARVGGDEFVAVLVDLAGEAPLHAFAGRVKTLIDEPFDLSGVHASVSVSVGTAFSGALTSSDEDLFRTADAAMYEEKRRHHELAGGQPPQAVAQLS